eukprot:7759797-Pyramimonas_sp.AAC.1
MLAEGAGANRGADKQGTEGAVRALLELRNQQGHPAPIAFQALLRRRGSPVGVSIGRWARAQRVRS